MQNDVDERTDMTGTFPGRIVLAEGDEVDIDLQMGAGKIRLATPFAEIGAWDAGTVEISARADDGFDLAVADDVVTFYPNDPASFGSVIESTGSRSEAPEEPFVFPGASAESGSRPAVETGGDTRPGGPGDDTSTREGSIDDLDAALEALRAESDEARPETGDTASVEASGVTPEVAADDDTEEAPAAEAGRTEITPESFPSSSGRLARAKARLRRTEEIAEPEAFADGGEAGTPADDEASRRRVSSGFLIPGDPGYVDPLAASPDLDETEDFDTEDDDEETIADEILEQRSATLRLTSTVKRSLPFDLRTAGIAAGVLALIAIVIFAAPVVMEILSGDDEGSTTGATETTVAPTTTTEPAPTTTTVASTTTAVPVTSDAFDISSQQFVERWNGVASDVQPALRFRALLPSGDFEAGFTEYIAMLGTVGPDGTLDGFTIEIDPAGPSESDQLGIQVLGVAIAVVDPTLEPAERAQLLGVLGLDVRDPDLGGLDGSVTRNGVEYSLRFDEEAVLLLFSIQPAP